MTNIPINNFAHQVTGFNSVPEKKPPTSEIDFLTRLKKDDPERYLAELEKWKKKIATKKTITGIE